MGFPAKLKNMNLFDGANSYLGVAKEVTPPKWALKMEEWRGGGMLGPVKVDLGLNGMELDFTLGGLESASFKQFGQTAYDGVLLSYRGAYQDDSSGVVKAVVINVNGKYEEIDFGNSQAGNDTDHKYKVALNYTELIVDGVQWAQIDMVAGIFIIFGTDRYAQIRAALGV